MANRTILTSEIADKIGELRSLGYGKKRIAKMLDLAPTTVGRWIKQGKAPEADLGAEMPVPEYETVYSDAAPELPEVLQRRIDDTRRELQARVKNLRAAIHRGPAEIHQRTAAQERQADYFKRKARERFED